jgi:hypothetical protein
MKHPWWNEALGGMFASLVWGSAVVLLRGAGVNDELAFGIPSVVVGVIGWVWWAVARVNRKPLPEPMNALTSGEVESLRARTDEVELLLARITELEERVEFSERLLSQQRDERAAL